MVYSQVLDKPPLFRDLFALIRRRCGGFSLCPLNPLLFDLQLLIMPTQLHWDLVGAEPAYPAQYRVCIARPCPRCHVASWEQCRNLRTGYRSHLPCLARLTNAA